MSEFDLPAPRQLRHLPSPALSFVLPRLLLAICLLACVGVWWISDGRTRALLINTAWLSGATVALAMPVAVMLAALVARTDVLGRRPGMVALAWLLFLPQYVQVGAWQAGFGISGWQAHWLGAPWVDGWRGALWVHVAAAVPWAALIVALALRAVPRSLEEMALLDSSPLRVFCRVTLRHAVPGIVAASVAVAVLAAGEITITDAFQVRTYAEEIYTQTVLGAGPGEAPLRTLPGMVLIASLTMLACLFVLRIAHDLRAAADARPLVFALGRWRVACSMLLLVAILVLVGLPLANLAWKSGVQVMQTPEGRVRYWSAARCLAAVISAHARYRREIMLSVGSSACAATMAAAAAVWLAWTARRATSWPVVLLAVVVLLIAVPAPLWGVMIIRAMNSAPWGWLAYLYDRTIVPLVLAQALRILPFVALLVWYAVRRIPRQQWESAATEGAGSIATLWRVVLPQCTGAIAVAWLVGFALAVGEFGATVLVVAPGTPPLSVAISGLLHTGIESEVASICLLLALDVSLIAMAISLWINRNRRGHGQ